MTVETIRNEADGLRWFAVQTRHHHEKRIAERLQQIEIETFLPVHRSVHRWKNGVNAELELPLFPCYLFTRVKEAQRLRLVRQPGVIGIAASNTSPTPIGDDEISRLRLVAEQVKAQPHPYLAVGERVRIIAGALAGMEGILTRRKHELRVVISIEIIMRSVTVEISEFEIEPIRVRTAG
jgi:transcription antitermination factor NusG